jgi:hypothetical protein
MAAGFARLDLRRLPRLALRRTRAWVSLLICSTHRRLRLLDQPHPAGILHACAAHLPRVTPTRNDRLALVCSDAVGWLGGARKAVPVELRSAWMRGSGRAITVVTLALGGAFVGACNETAVEPGDPPSGKAVDETAIEPGDVGSDSADNKAGVVPGDEECDERRFNDRKKPDDFCWAPPSNYCAQGAGAAGTEACDPETGICCTYGTTCIPCGFVDCTHCRTNRDRPADCPDLCFGPHSSDPKACKQPDMDLVVCYRE